MRRNKLEIIGYVGNNATVKHIGEHVAVHFDVAVPAFKKEDDATWFRCNWWGQRAEKCAPYLSKGTPVFVEGEVGFKTWDARDGALKIDLTVRVQDVVLLGGKHAR